MQAQLLNPAGAALVRHINWWRALFFRCLNLASKKDGAFDILLLRCWFYLLRILNNAIFGLLFYWNLSKVLQNTSTLPVFSIWFKFYPITWWHSVGFFGMPGQTFNQQWKNLFFSPLLCAAYCDLCRNVGQIIWLISCLGNSQVTACKHSKINLCHYEISSHTT